MPDINGMEVARKIRRTNLQDINKQYPDVNFSMDIAPFSQQGDMLFISKAGYECSKNLSFISSMNYFNEFEKQVSQVFEKQGKTDDVKSDTFEHQVNRMAAVYNKMQKRQEILQEITNLEQQLRQHEIEQRRKQQSESASTNDMQTTSLTASSKGNGLSQASTQAIISADVSMKQAKHKWLHFLM